MRTYKTTIILACLILMILAAGCEEEAIPEVPEDSKIGGGQMQVDCALDSDCITGGCSGTICQSKSAKPIMTTCEYKEEYACYRQIECACINNKCEWDKTSAFDKCVEEARGKTSVVPIV